MTPEQSDRVKKLLAKAKAKPPPLTVNIWDGFLAAWSRDGYGHAAAYLHAAADAGRLPSLIAAAESAGRLPALLAAADATHLDKVLDAAERLFLKENS